MKRKDILPCMGRGFVGGTLLVQSFNAFQAHKLGSLIGLVASLIIFTAMNWKSCKSCSSSKDCDIGNDAKAI
ncbi:MAG: hypothetical protein R3A80_14005 [Bdellovibrionota bacterium]